MRIIHAPHIVLNRPVRKVPLQKRKENSSLIGIDKRTKKIIREMIEALESARNPEGVGLAANQVGLSMAIFVMKPKKTSDVTVCINPEILKVESTPSKKKLKSKSGSKRGSDKNLEGCLSIPRIWGEVDRADRVLLSFIDIEGQHQEKLFEGFEALIVQHEMDHLNGILFTQRALEQGYRLVKEVGNGEFERYEI